MTAVKGRNLEVVKLLLEAGADPFLESEGVSAAQIAQVSPACIDMTEPRSIGQNCLSVLDRLYFDVTGDW